MKILQFFIVLMILQFSATSIIFADEVKKEPLVKEVKENVVPKNCPSICSAQTTYEGCQKLAFCTPSGPKSDKCFVGDACYSCMNDGKCKLKSAKN